MGAPDSCVGSDCGFGIGYVPVPVRASMQPLITAASAARGVGRAGTEVSGFEKLKAEVMSPTSERRQAERFGTSAPKRVSRKRRTDVWSKLSDEMKPPRLKGETMSIGTRKPRPMGPLMPPRTDESGTGVAVMYSPAVPGGAVGGATWSKKPPFSS